jgi:hypothetical protein
MCVYDPARDRVLMFGGANNGITDNGFLNDFWGLEFGSGDGQWQPIQVAGVPLPRSPGLLCLDTIRDRLLLFGGYGFSSPTSVDILNDTWAFDMSGVPAWRQLAPAGFLPLPRVLVNGGTYDAAQDRLVLSGGAGSSDLWTLAFAAAPAAAAGRVELPGAGEMQVVVSAPSLELSANATGGRVKFAVQLPSGDPATLSLFDVAGRSVWSTSVGQLGAGSHEVEMSGPAPPPALYFARLSQGRLARHARVVVVQ